MDLLQEYKELYYKELELKDSMSGKIGTSVTLITILCTGHMFMWDIMIRLDFVIHPIPMIFLILEIVSVFYTCLSMYNFYKTYFRYKYHLVSIEGIRESIDNNNSLKNYFQPYQIQQANYDMMCNTFYEYAIKNRKENIRKNLHQMNLSSSLVKAITSLILTYTMWMFIISQFTF